ncbi:cytospin-A-like, partial [Ascaphus truei]|uniref:cytospin-A-like n=1 Tax=Ascaphus truei TaxID=8439 RepID=UPI003F59AD6E
SDPVDWRDPVTTNGSTQGYHSLPRGVILSPRDTIMKSSSLLSVPPTAHAPSQETGPGSSRRERRGSLETLLNESKATENLNEDSGSFFRRYGGSKRGVFLRWAQDRTCGYKHVVITNFSSSWVDGMAFCALLDSYLPQCLTYTQLRPLEKRKNLQLAFQVGESVGIPALLTPDHMLQMQGPDWQKVLLYVESIYQKFEA